MSDKALPSPPPKDLPSTPDSPLPPVRRVVTGHAPDATAVVKSDDTIPSIPLQIGPSVTPLWATEELPADVSSPQDKAQLETGLTNDGAIMRILDVPPGAKFPLHRTVSLDYVYVVRGEVVLTLDDGSRTTVRANDVVVQQATMHGWENETNSWARMLLVMMRSQEPVVGGKRLEEDVGFKIE
ncbi:cupin domain protein [Diplodia corticola]|uniref:Cupin domain protein n=1 Tax=Diplodia corticola TaxID=236234 RepID=A0A1J9R085_9PEZI|nr:cupin domain protein [Diplodia corticola]OJD34040.1 cupin domain protein [Diplodia corticola]